MRIKVNGKQVEADPGTTVAAAILNSGFHVMRTSAAGHPRAALCGMGVCFECRVTVNGAPHARSCQIVCLDGMEIETS